MIKNSRKLSGFTLVEVLVFVTVLSFFFIMAVTVTTFLLKNMKVQEHKIIAVRFAEEGLEWVKQEKEDDWQTFITHGVPTDTAVSYCLNSLDWSTKTDCGNNYTLGQPVGIFKRVLVITNSGNPVNRVTADITTSWLESNTEQKVILKTVLNLLE